MAKRADPQKLAASSRFRVSAFVITQRCERVVAGREDVRFLEVKPVCELRVVLDVCGFQCR